MGSGGRLLMIDDDRLVLRAVGRSLRRRGHEVVEVEDVATALTLIHSGDRFDMLLLDLRLGVGGDPRDLLCELSQAAPDHLRRIVFYTGGPRDERDAQLLVGRRVLLKPASCDQIEELLRAFVESRAA